MLSTRASAGLLLASNYISRGPTEDHARQAARKVSRLDEWRFERRGKEEDAEPAIQARQLITSRKPDDVPVFAREMLGAFGGAPKDSTNRRIDASLLR